MTAYTALGAASETFRALLQAHITDSDLADLKTVPIDMRSPEDLDRANVTTSVSLWLYRVSVQPDLRNALPRPSGDGLTEHMPLPLELDYLVTALHSDVKTHLALTGRILQVVNDHPRLRGALLKDALAGTDTELRLSIGASTLNESSDLWYSLQSPFRLAVPVTMQVATVASHLPPVSGPRVVQRPARVGEPVGGAA